MKVVKRLVYDGRAVHLPPWGTDLGALAARGIEWLGWWLPGQWAVMQRKFLVED